MDQSRLSDGFCLNSLDITFCVIHGNGLEGLVLVAQGQKSLFPCWPTLHHLFCYHIYWCGDTQEGHLGCCLSLYDSPLLLRSALYSGMCPGTLKTEASPGSTSLGNIPGTTLASQTNVLVVRNWKSVWDAIRPTPGAPLPRLRGTTRRDE